MPDDAKRKARDDAKRAQSRYERERSRLDQAANERRESFERAQAAGLSLAEIAEATGLHRSRVDQILKGK
jgi:DNA-directed RNA polymerase specialized sigma24 family protein